MGVEVMVKSEVPPHKLSARIYRQFETCDTGEPHTQMYVIHAFVLGNSSFIPLLLL